MPKQMLKYHGFYRALVVDNVDKEFFGRVMVWIPDIMPKVPQTKGLWALPANNPTSGLNKKGDSQHFYSGSCYIPPKGSYVWIFFEKANPRRPYYIGGLDIQETKVLPECQLGDNPEKKWVIYKSHSGRTIVISDDPKDERVEITGKKRQLSEPPVGDKTSVYTIDGNQTTILIDERDGSEKVLIKSHNSNYINFDITNNKLDIYVNSDINIYSGGKICIQSDSDINLFSGNNINIQAGANVNIKSSANLNSEAGAIMNHKAGGPINLDGASVNEMTGAAQPAGPADQAKPKGDRG